VFPNLRWVRWGWKILIFRKGMSLSSQTKYDQLHDKTGYRQCCVVVPGQKLSQGADILIISRARQQSQFVLRYRAGNQHFVLKMVNVISEGLSSQQPRSLPAPASQTRPSSTNGAVYLHWSEWSGCSELCGACGTRTRSRTCAGGICRYEAFIVFQKCQSIWKVPFFKQHWLWVKIGSVRSTKLTCPWFLNLKNFNRRSEMKCFSKKHLFLKHGIVLKC